MKIVLMAPRLPPAHDGVGDSAHALASACVSEGHNVHVLTAGDDATATVYRATHLGPSWGLTAAARACAILTRERADAFLVEYTPFLYGVFSPVPLIVTRFARAIGVPCTVIAHEAFYGLQNGAVTSGVKAAYFALRDRAVLEAADRIAVPSEARRERIAARLPHIAERIRVVPIGANVEPPPWYARAAAKNGRHEIVAFGVVMRRHRFELAIETLALLRKRFDARLTVVGRVFDEDYARRCMQRAAELGVADRVTFTGALDAAEISQRWSRADVAIYATTDGVSGSSGSLLALLAHGLPIVAAGTPAEEGAFNDVVIHTGEDANAIAEGVVRLITRPDDARDLGMRAMSRYRDAFGWASAAQILTCGYVARGLDERVACS